MLLHVVVMSLLAARLMMVARSLMAARSQKTLAVDKGVNGE
jgi:hypothetical protein